MFFKKEIAISDSEWLVMQALWSKSPVYMCDIVSALGHTPWRRTTIQTMVARLASKKAVGVNRTNKAFLYYPLISEKEAVKIYTKYFIDIINRGKAINSITRIVSGDFLTEQEKKTIKSIL